MYEKYEDQGLVVLGVNVSDDRKIALEYLVENRVTFPNVFDISGRAQQVMMRYETLQGFSAVPMTYVIDREGKVVDAWYDFREDLMEKALEKLGYE